MVVSLLVRTLLNASGPADKAYRRLSFAPHCKTAAISATFARARNLFHFNELGDKVNRKILALKSRAREPDCPNCSKSSMDLLPSQYDS
jgi:hypothetical protein